MSRTESSEQGGLGVGEGVRVARLRDSGVGKVNQLNVPNLTKRSKHAASSCIRVWTWERMKFGCLRRGNVPGR